MKLQELGERELIRQFVVPELTKHQSSYLGDDCAVLPLSEDRVLLVTTDASPKRPFLSVLQVGSYVDLGHYFAIMSISDIAAMGGEPLALVAACMLEPDFLAENFRNIIVGISLACEECGVKYLGGDTKEGANLQVVTTVIGTAHPSKVLTRRGSKVGDLVCVSGPIGKTLGSYLNALSQRRLNIYSDVHRPRARVELGASLANKRLATACLDMSDGPVNAARTLGEMNKVTVVLNIEDLALAPTPTPEIPVDLWNSFILNTGGDFELMFTIPEHNRFEVESLGGLICGVVTESVEADGVSLVGWPSTQEISPSEHFRSTRRITDILESML